MLSELVKISLRDKTISREKLFASVSECDSDFCVFASNDTNFYFTYDGGSNGDTEVLLYKRPIKATSDSKWELVDCIANQGKSTFIKSLNVYGSKVIVCGYTKANEDTSTWFCNQYVSEKKICSDIIFETNASEQPSCKATIFANGRIIFCAQRQDQQQLLWDFYIYDNNKWTKDAHLVCDSNVLATQINALITNDNDVYMLSDCYEGSIYYAVLAKYKNHKVSSLTQLPILDNDSRKKFHAGGVSLSDVLVLEDGEILLGGEVCINNQFHWAIYDFDATKLISERVDFSAAKKAASLRKFVQVNEQEIFAIGRIQTEANFHLIIRYSLDKGYSWKDWSIIEYPASQQIDIAGAYIVDNQLYIAVYYQQ